MDGASKSLSGSKEKESDRNDSDPDGDNDTDPDCDTDSDLDESNPQALAGGEILNLERRISKFHINILQRAKTTAGQLNCSI